MTDKTYWGLSEIELNQFWKSLPNHKDKKNIFLSLEEHYKEPYEYYLDKVKIIEPDFTEEMLINISEDMIEFRNKSEFTEYAEYKKNSKSDKSIKIEDTVSGLHIGDIPP